MKLEDAKRIAVEYYAKKGAIVAKIYESVDHWIVYAEKDGKTVIGAPALSIAKNSGELGQFLLPNKENFAILKMAKLVFDKK